MIITSQVAIILLVGSFTQAAIGFGYGAIFIGACSLIMPIPEVIVESFLYGAIIQLILILLTIKQNNYMEAIKFTSISMIGLPIGAYIFKEVNIDMLRKLFGVFLIGCAIVSVVNKIKFSQKRIIFFGAGIGSGILSALFGSSGPFIAVYLLSNHQLKRAQHIFILNSVFFAASIVMGCTYFMQGKYQNTEPIMLVKGGVVVIVGTLSGYLFGKKFTEKWHRHVVQATIFIIGLVLIVT